MYERKLNKEITDNAMKTSRPTVSAGASLECWFIISPKSFHTYSDREGCIEKKWKDMKTEDVTRTDARTAWGFWSLWWGLTGHSKIIIDNAQWGGVHSTLVHNFEMTHTLTYFSLFMFPEN